ncbi:hypothetical protein [Urbifossiella limnaea]|uniref:Periplasmic heavy metal sensor n=1 Tax=Urbifossiella limnaea TaxID=2528023 RepID=A0A517XTP7_9BACT|nr:hypothetical protein [Urbifossiella limnaea]QDU20872.1 hypothetical protein ETAA1_28350 [Urbifossiella limnaea]
MRWTSVAVALLTAGVAWGQPPGGGGPQPGFRPDGPGGPVEKADPQVEAWVKTLTDKMNDPHDAIRESARAALVAVGNPALPALRGLAGGNDAKAFTARRLVQQIERGAVMGGFGVAGGMAVPGGFGGPGVFPSPGGPPPMPVPGGPMGTPPGRRPVPDAAPGSPVPLRGALDELKLDAKQQTLVEKAIENYTTKLRELLDGVRGGKIDRDEMREAVPKLIAEATAELNRALTPEQRATLERLMPRGRPLFPTPFQYGETPPGRPERGEPNTPERPRTPRPNPDGGR